MNIYIQTLDNESTAPPGSGKYNLIVRVALPSWAPLGDLAGTYKNYLLPYCAIISGTSSFVIIKLC